MDLEDFDDDLPNFDSYICSNDMSLMSLFSCCFCHNIPIPENAAFHPCNGILYCYSCILNNDECAYCGSPFKEYKPVRLKTGDTLVYTLLNELDIHCEYLA